jgi:hypothetical protein
MSIARQEFTNAGRNILGRANNGEQLTFTRIVIGAGAAAVPSDLWPLTALIDHRFDVPILAQVDQGNGILILDGVINSAAIPAGQGFDLRELGAMAHIGAEPDQLYSVANVLLVSPDYIPDEIENPAAVHAFKIKVVIDRAPNVTIQLGTSQDILAENIGAETVGPGWFKEKIANTLRFKRAINGTGIELIDEPDTITISQKTLEIDLDLFVSIGAPDIFPNYSTIENAWNYLADIQIPPGRSANIRVAPGRYVADHTFVFKHPQGDQIQVIGTDPIDTLVTSSGTMAGGIGAYTWTINVADASDMAAGDVFALIQGGAAGGSLIHQGGFQVITATATSIAFSFTSYIARTIADIGDCTGWIVRKYPSQLRWTTDVNGLNVKAVGCNLSNLAFSHIGARSAQSRAIHIDETPSRVTIQNIAAARWFHCLQGFGSGISVSLSNYYASDNANGLVLNTCFGDLGGNIFVGCNGSFGLWSVTGATLSTRLTSIVASLNGQGGALSDTNSVMIFDNAACTFNANAQYGIRATYRGFIRKADPGGGMSLGGNPNTAVADQGGLIHCAGAVPTTGSNPLSGTPVGSPGNSESGAYVLLSAPLADETPTVLPENEH